MVRIYYGRAGDNVSTKLMSELEHLSRTGRKAFLVVPEQLSMKREYAVNKLGLSNVTVLNFNRLANEVFRRFGGTAKKLPNDAMNIAAVCRAVLNVYPSLTYYKSVAMNAGFISKLADAFSDFDLNCITIDAVRAVPKELMPPSTLNKYNDLFTVYDEYKRLWTEDYKAPGDNITTAAGMLEINDFFEGTTVMFDGFYGFTPQQYLMLERIIEQSDDCIFSFITDLCDPLFDTVSAEVSALYRLCEKMGVAYFAERINGGGYFENASLAELEGIAFDTSSDKISNTDGITVYSAVNITDELNFIACKIKNDVLGGKYRYRDIAVIAPYADAIHSTLTAVFAKHGIPTLSDTKRTLLSKPLCAFVLNAFDIALDGFEYENTFAFLKTGLTGIHFDDISLIENYVRTWKLRNKNWSDKPWTQNPAGLTQGEPDTERLKKINMIREKIYTPLNKFRASVHSERSCRDMLRAAVTLLEDFKVWENLEAHANTFKAEGDLQNYNEYLRVYDLFIDMLDSIDAIFADEMISPRRLCDLISVCAMKTEVSSVPSRADEVIFAGVGRVRAENVKCVYIPRMNDGIIPAPVTDSSLITESDKRLFNRCGIRTSMDFLASAKRERFDLYSAMFSATHELVLSYSMFEITGESRTRSGLLDNILSKADVTELCRDDIPYGFYLVSVPAASDLAANGRFESIENAIYELSGFAPITERTPDTKLSDDIVSGLYSKNLHLSFSGVEEYVNCPFKFFIHRGLRAGKNEPVEFNPANVGTFIHSGLETLLSGRYNIENADADSIKQMVCEISDDYYNTALADCKGRSKRFDYLFSRAKYAFENAAVSVVGEINSSDFEPYDFEVDISDHIPPFELHGGYTLSLVGSIDRVDITKDGTLAKVVDYKSGSQKFSLEKMYNGISMQLPIYAGAVRSKHKDIKIAAMYYLKVGIPDADNKESFGKTAEQYMQSIADYYTRDGIYSVDDDVQLRLDNSGRYFTKIKKDRLVDSDSINRLIDFTMQKVRQIGESITDGDISVSPICNSAVDACMYCDYKNICMIDKKQENKRTLEKLPDDFLRGEE